MLCLAFFLSVPFFFHFRNKRPLSSSLLFADSLPATANLFPTSGPDGHCRVVLETESLQNGTRKEWKGKWRWKLAFFNLQFESLVQSPICVDRRERLIISMDGNKDGIFSFSGESHINRPFVYEILLLLANTFLDVKSPLHFLHFQRMWAY